ncbi:alpha/beta fold hydrolase [Sorangium sp. So ce233]|uniref:alpha/beta fold hydrolase n=1 Tax=Sorangium sp. So ce233 TaxID=3133290 RepID=UPI003F635349
MTSWLLAKTEEFLGDLVSEVSEIRRDTISPDADFQEFGLDSRFVIAMNSRLEQYFSGLPRTLFFEYPSIRAVASYLVEEFQDQLHALFPDGEPADASRPAPSVAVAIPSGAPPSGAIPSGAPPSGAIPSGAPPQTSTSSAADLSDLASLIQQIPLPEAVLSRAERPRVDARPAAPAPSVARTSSSDQSGDDIAVIGVAGRYPKARNIEEFWRNLREGRDCIEPLPKERWNPDPSDPLRWGGYLDGVTDFDSLFFGISPREGEGMDPQERLFLEVAWETIESAGYDPLRLARNGEPASVGVFVGVMYGEYQVFGAELTLLGQPTLVSSSYATIPNRVSYFLNFSGPSLALDTMCSSSLTALHLACASLRSGDCKMALVGGTNVTIHPNKYRLLEAGKYLASDGRCRSYGADGDGYVPAEGVGAVLIKPLADARRDGDTIWGIIKSTSINHGARARGYTTPNPNAQAASLSLALERAKIEPHTLGYIEGHGTGTSLGDPIEIRGIQKAVGRVPEKIPIGSVKSNIGHAESAAGVAGLTKVLLQLRARELVPSIHCEPPNPNIDFDRAPIQVQRHAAPWNRRTVTSGGVTREVPRRAVVSAFGAGGSNAHVIVEEADAPALQRTVSAQPRLFVLSARSVERLRAHAQSFLDFFSRMPTLREPEARELFYDMCATLYFGRAPFEARLAIVTESLRTLQQKLAAFVYGASRDPDILVSDGRSLAATDGGQRQLSGLADLGRRWVAGEAVDASELFPHPWRKLSLPTYPFERRRLWAPSGEKLYDLRSAAAPAPAAPPGNGASPREAPAEVLRATRTDAAQTAVLNGPQHARIAPAERRLDVTEQVIEVAERPSPPDRGPSTSEKRGSVSGPHVTTTLNGHTSTLNGHAAPATGPERPAATVQAADQAAPVEIVQEMVRDLVAQILFVDRSTILPDAALFDYGLESVSSVELAERINAMLGVDITPTSFFEFNTLAHFSRHLVERYDLSGRLSGLSAGLAGGSSAPAGPSGRGDSPPRAAAGAERPVGRAAAAEGAAEPAAGGHTVEELWASAMQAEGIAALPSREPRRSASDVERPAPPVQAADQATPIEVVQEMVRDLVAQILFVDRSTILPNTALFDYGLESVSSVELAERLNAMLGVDITPTSFFEFNTLAHFSRHLVERYNLADRLSGLSAGLAGGSSAPARASAPRAQGPAALSSSEPRRSDAEIELHVIPGVDGHAVEFATLGSGVPLIVLGGLLATHDALTLNPDILSLGQTYRVIMVHPPGAGRSELPRGELTMDFIVRQIESVRQSLGISPVVLVGYSFGGLVAQAYVAQFPERASKLVLACTTSDPASVVNGMHLVAAEAQRHPDGLRALQFADVSKFPLYSQLSTRLRPETLAYPAIPTLIVAGAEDRYVPTIHAERLARANPSATLHIVEGAGHFLGLSHGGVLVSLVNGFVLGDRTAPVRSPAVSASRRGGLLKMSQESVGALKSYLEEGEIASGVEVSPVAGQVGYLLNRLLSGQEAPSSPYHCFFMPSGLEAVDAALRFGRRRAKLSRGLGDAKTLVLDPEGALRRHFEFLPQERLFPDLIFVGDSRELLRLLQSAEDVGAAYVTTACDDATLETVAAECARRGIVSVLAELHADTGELVSARLRSKPDVVVLDEAIAGFELPFGVCAIRRFHESGVWTRQPEEFAVRVPGSMTGPALTVVRENILRRFRSVVTSDTTANLRAIAVDQGRTKEAHRSYVNPVLLESLDAFGLAGRQRRADRRGYEIERDDGSSARVINLYLVTSASFRGHTGSEIAQSVLGAHDVTRDYWADLEQRIPRETGFGRIFPAAGPATAVESAVKLGLLAARKGSALLVLKGSPIFTRLGALVSQAEPGSPLEALVESCPWSKVMTVDPFGEGAAAELEAKLTSGDVGFVWLETLQSDWGGLRSVPEAVLEVIDRHRERSGYLVGVDETYTSLGCGRMFHWQGKLARPDVVAVCVGWTDCQLLAGYVLTTEEAAARARQHNEAAVSALQEQLRCQLTAHATLRLLDVLKEDRILTQIAETERRFSGALNDFAAECGLVKRVWGEGLFWAVQFDLDGWPRFVRDWFSSFLWSECLRDPVAPIALSMQPLTPACIRVEPRYDIPAAELDAAMGTLKRVLGKGVEGIVSSVADDVERRGDARRAELFRRVLRGFKTT